jgi:hypothetical protein
MVRVLLLTEKLADKIFIAGFELYTDLLFADFLVNVTPYVPYVVFQYADSSMTSIPPLIRPYI